MKRKDITELRAKTAKELNKMLADLQMKLAVARMEKKAGKLENTSLVTTLADDVARIKTTLRAMELAGEEKEAK
ncbi:MAG: 50S ribosomal protein L29 [Patescibacteria group bacterium]